MGAIFAATYYVSAIIFVFMKEDPLHSNPLITCLQAMLTFNFVKRTCDVKGYFQKNERNNECHRNIHTCSAIGIDVIDRENALQVLVSNLLLRWGTEDAEIDFKTHFKVRKPASSKAVQILLAPFFSKWPLYYHLTLRGRHFTSALCTVLKACYYLRG